MFPPCEAIYGRVYEGYEKRGVYEGEEDNMREIR